MNGIVAMPTISAKNVMVDGRPLTEVLAELAVPPRAVEPPTLSDTTPVYTGAMISLADQLVGYDPTAMTLTGVAAATDAGEYPAAVELLPRCTWPDGSTEQVEITWNVARAPGSITLSETEVELTAEALTAYIDVERLGEGEITAESSDPDVATVAVNGAQIAITGLGGGLATISVSVAQSANHEAVAQTVSVKVQIVSEVLAENSAPVILQAIRDGIAPSLWNVGDTYPGTLHVDDPLDFMGLALNLQANSIILGFNHNAALESGGKPNIHFGALWQNTAGKPIALCEKRYGTSIPATEYDGFFMQTVMDDFIDPGKYDGYNVGVWDATNLATACDVFTWSGYCDDNTRQLVTEYTKYTYVKWDRETASGEILKNKRKSAFLLSEYEVFGKTTYSNALEASYQQQYEYFKNGASKIAYKHAADTQLAKWWLRSSSSKNTTEFVCVSTTGAVETALSPICLGFRVAFQAA